MSEDKPKPVMRKMSSVDGTDVRLWYACPGCHDIHCVRIKGQTPEHVVWDWNGSLVKPTITPSILVNMYNPDRICHSFITDGNIKFLEDCYHELKGTIVPLEPFFLEEWC